MSEAEQPDWDDGFDYHIKVELDGVPRKLEIMTGDRRLPGMPSLILGEDPRKVPDAHRIEMSSDQALHLANKLLEWFLWERCLPDFLEKRGVKGRNDDQA